MNEKESTEEILKRLTKPWEKKEVKWRVGPLSKDKTMTVPLAYVDARTVMNRLDEIMGAENWQDNYVFPGNRIICTLSLKLRGEWVHKEDGAGDSEMEGEKGGISDAFKRAAVKWGMGRELYELKCKWMQIDQYKKIIGDPWKHLLSNITEDISGEPKEDGKKLLFLKTIGEKIDNSTTLEVLENCLSQEEKDYLNNILRFQDTVAFKMLSQKRTIKINKLKGN